MEVSLYYTENLGNSKPNLFNEQFTQKLKYSRLLDSPPPPDDIMVTH